MAASPPGASSEKGCGSDSKNRPLAVEPRVAEFVAHASIGPKTCKRLEVDVPGSCVREYQIQNSVDDGFIRLYSSLGHRYWIAQAQARHCTPDWKIHISVDLRDLPLAWDIVAGLFVSLGCRAAMKAVNLALPPPEFMRGREITVYIYRHDRRYDGARYHDPIESDDSHTLHRDFEQDSQWWLQLIVRLEDALSRAGVRSAGLAAGDARLPYSTLLTYCSYRNEAFVRVPRKLEQAMSADERAFQSSFQGAAHGLSYPPNAMGYNAAGHRDPFRSAGRHRRWIRWHVACAASVVLVAVAMAWRSPGISVL